MAAPLSEITAILRDVLHDDGIHLSSTTRFEELTDWDSTDLLSVVDKVESRYDLHIALPEIDRLTTIGDLVRMVEVKRTFAMA